MDIKRYQNITLSIVAHTIALYWISTTVTVLPQEEAKPNVTAIKSYIYRPAAKKIIVTETASKTPSPQTLKSTPETLPAPTAKIKPLPIEVIENIVEINKHTVETIQKKRTKIITNDVSTTKHASAEYSITSKAKRTEISKPVATLSPQAMIGNLRKAINKNIIEKEVKRHQPFRSISVMHKNPPSVPKSVTKLTPDQRKELNTIQMSSSIAITKLKNGVCMIEREKQIGIDIDSSTSWFACGESDFDKSFRQHMEKVRQKTGPVN